VAASRAGGKVFMVGRIGADEFASALQNSLENSRVDTTYLKKTPGSSTGVALITLDAQGQNTIVVASGANGLLSPEDILAAEPAFEGAAVLLLQLEIPIPTVAKAVEIARKHSVRVVLNPAPAQALNPDLLKQIDYLIPNEYELALLTGIEPVAMAVNALHDLGTRAVIVTLGGNGAMVAEGGSHEHIPGYTVPVVDTVAAGDAFVGAFAVALAEGRSAQEAAAWGNAAGAISVTRSGAQPSLPWREELEAFLKEHSQPAEG
jgi:ribokinase